LTALGPIDVRRSHGYCGTCGLPGFPTDGLLGIDGWMTVRAAGMTSLAGVNDPFRKSDDLLRGLCGWRVCAETIRQRCHAAAAAAREYRGRLTGLPESFKRAQAQGQEYEAHIDAGKVNTPDGWRDVKVVAFACRKPGESSTPADYEQRELPAASVRSVVAEVEQAGAFGLRCKAEAERLGVSVVTTDDAPADHRRLTVLGDGAEWIWNLAAEQFGGAAQVLDVYHAVEKVAVAGREALGTGTAALGRWLDEARAKLVGDGYCGVCEVLAGPLEGGDEEARARMNAKAGEVLNYFCGHRDRLGYALRLLRGQAIGSGLVEGTIKQRVNVRMKRGSARWLPRHVGPFVELLAVSDTPEWSEFWSLMAA
jgi:hypothetical protein